MTSWSRSVRTGAAALALAALGACSSSDGGAAGTGGAAAGSGGNPGCTTAPNCSGCEACFDTCLCNGGAADACLLKCTSGSGGSAGTGGSAGSGATGGATGGSGGSTGGSGGSGGVPCTEVTTGSPSCNACIHGACCSQIESCFNDPACGGLANCLSSYCASAADLSACASQYCGQYGAGVNAYNTMAQCFANNCASSC